MTTSLNTAVPFSKGKREQRINIKRDLMQNCFSFKHHHSSVSTYKQSPISANGPGPPAQWLSITKILKPWVETQKKLAIVFECNNQKLKCIMNLRCFWQCSPILWHGTALSVDFKHIKSCDTSKDYLKHFSLQQK